MLSLVEHEKSYIILGSAVCHLPSSYKPPSLHTNAIKCVLILSSLEGA